MNTFGIDGFFTGLVYLILVAAGLGVLVSVPAFFVAGAIGLGSKLLGKKSTNDDPALDADIMDVKKETSNTNHQCLGKKAKKGLR